MKEILMISLKGLVMIPLTVAAVIVCGLTAVVLVCLFVTLARWEINAKGAMYMKYRIIFLNFIRAAWMASIIGVWITLHILYFSSTEVTGILRVGSVLSFMAIVYLLFYYLNRSIFSLVELNNISSAVQAQQIYLPLTLKERLLHNIVLAPCIVTLVYILVSVDLLKIHYIFCFILLVVQLFVGNVSSYRFSQVFYPYYKKQSYGKK